MHRPWMKIVDETSRSLLLLVAAFRTSATTAAAANIMCQGTLSGVVTFTVCDALIGAAHYRQANFEFAARVYLIFVYQTNHNQNRS